MKRIILSFLAIVFLWGCVTLESGEVRRQRRYSKEKRHHRISYDYRYYPDCNVYYDLGRKIYFYFYKGWWHMAVELPNYGCIKIDDYQNYIIVTLNVSEPYRDHDEVLKKVPPAWGKYKKKNRNHPKYRR